MPKNNPKIDQSFFLDLALKINLQQPVKATCIDFLKHLYTHPALQKVLLWKRAKKNNFNLECSFPVKGKKTNRNTNDGQNLTKVVRKFTKKNIVRFKADSIAGQSLFNQKSKQEGTWLAIKMGPNNLLTLYSKKNNFPFSASHFIAILNNFSTYIIERSKKDIFEQFAQKIHNQQAYENKDLFNIQMILENTFDCILFVNKKSLRPIDCNTNTLKYFKCNKTSLLRKSLLNRSPKTQSDKINSKEKRDRIKKLLNAKKKLFFEWTFLKEDNSICHTEISTFSIGPIKGNTAIFLIKDITEAKTNLDKITQKDFQLKTTQDMARLGSFYFDRVNQTMTWTDELKKILRTKKQFSNQEFLKRIHPEDRELQKKKTKAYSTKGIPYIPNRIRFTRGDGKMIDILISYKAIKEGNKRVGTLGFIQDISELQQKTEEVKRSQEMFKTLFDNSPFGIVIRKVGSQSFVQLNPKAWDMFGRTEKEMLTLKRDKMIYRENKTERDRLTRKLLSGELKSFTLTKQYLKKDGTFFWGKATRSIINFNNEPHIFGVIEDIDAQKKTEQALIKSETSLREAQKMAKVGNWEFDLISGDISWSKEVYNIFNIQNPSPPSYEGYLKFIHSDDRKLLQNAVKNCIAKAEPYDLEIRHLNIDKKIIYARCKGKAVITDNQIVKIIGTIQDVTEQKMAEDFMIETNKKYIDLFENMYDALVITDKEGRFIDANKAAQKLLGHSFNELSQLRIPEIVHPDDLQRSKSFLDQLITEGFYSNYEGRIITKDKKVKYVQVNSNAIYKDGKFNGSRDIVRDVSEVVEANQKREALLKELEEVNKELKEFAYVVSHDLKAPLRAISSLSQWLATDYKDALDEAGQQHIQLLVSRVGRMHNFIEGILEYSRIGRIKIKKENIDLNQLINDIKIDLSPPPHFTIKVPKNLPTIYAEKIRMYQLFQNLISNALKYNDKKKAWVKITFQYANDDIRFSVTDNGLGIEEKYHNKIFQIFQTLQIRDKFESTGIGLTIVKRIIHHYGGNIKVKSKLGKGTSFEFLLKNCNFKMSPKA